MTDVVIADMSLEEKTPLNANAAVPTTAADASATAATAATSAATDVLIDAERNVGPAITYCKLDFQIDVVHPDTEQLRTLHILNNMSGTIRGGSMTALMGSSGSGKTTLLNALLGRSVGGTCKGSILVDGVVTSTAAMRQLSGYVTQDDIMSPNLTALENLVYTAHLKLDPAVVSHEDKVAKGEAILTALGLNAKMNCLVGVPGVTQGLSGGERKRVNIGRSLITDPQFLLLDEPTSGLDSKTAHTVMLNVRNLVQRFGKTCIATIHQPNFNTFALFDDLTLLAGGRVVYCGTRAGVTTHFSQLGHTIEPQVNPADFVVDLLDVAPEIRGSDEDADVKARAAVHAADLARVKTFVDAYDALSCLDVQADNTLLCERQMSQFDQRRESSRVPLWAQFKYLFGRSMKIQLRDKMMTKARLGQTIFIALLCGFLYFQMDLSQSSVGDRQGALFLVTANQFILATIGVLFSFPSEQALFVRERNEGLYSTKMYFAAKSIADAPLQIFFPFLFAAILYYIAGFTSEFGSFLKFSLAVVAQANCGAAMGFLVSGATGDVQMSLSLAPVTFLPMMLLSGFLVNFENLTWALRWLSFFNPFMYCFSMLMQNEFEDLVFTCSASERLGDRCPTQDGQQVLDRFNLQYIGGYWTNMLCMACLIAVLRVGGGLALAWSSRRYIND